MKFYKTIGILAFLSLLSPLPSLADSYLGADSSAGGADGHYVGTADDSNYVGAAAGANSNYVGAAAGANSNYVGAAAGANSNYVGLLAEDDSSINLNGVLLAQSDNSDAYDPFVDFSEFEEVTDEEADINFFRNGRFFTLGFVGSHEQFTDNLGRMYQNAFNYGIFLSYFFDLRFALQLTFKTGDHTIQFDSPEGTSVRGNAAVTSVGLTLKYYFNTQNVTRGLANLNPYLVGGFNQISRTATVSGESAFAKESATGLNVGAGIEIPMLRKKMYLGLQADYNLVNFADENREIVLQGGTESTGIFPSGDIVNISVILGVNF